jgi:hypothetical protein
MGIQSTTELTREEAERLYVAKRQKEFERKFRAEAVAMCDEDLERAIESQFDNYIITNRSD